jgi:RNA polymerase sigma factor (sigma-70 family)
LEQKEIGQRLSQINTQWTLILQAHEGQPDSVTAAQQQLLQRYSGAIYRYLLAAVRDANTADELAQEFAYRLVRGDFKRADPRRGRFRDLVKTAVINLYIDYQRRLRTRPQTVAPENLAETVAAPPSRDVDREFLEHWRQELLNHAWKDLAKVDEQTGQLFHTVLRLRVEQPGLRSAQMAEELSARLGRPITAASLRQTLHRAREKFSDLLLDEVALSLEQPTAEELQDELCDLGLLDYCRPALERRAQS